MLSEPQIISGINYINVDLSYEWNDSIEEKITEGYNKKLIDLLQEMNYKAIFGLGIAVSELIFWRLSKWRKVIEGRDVDTHLLFTEAHWLGLIDKCYMLNWNYSAEYIDGNKIESLLWFITRQFVFVRHFYKTNDERIYVEISRFIMLARHISPDKVFFGNWLNSCIKRLIELFPNQQLDENDNVREEYDSAQDAFIPRAFFFEPSFDYKVANLNEIKEKLLNDANYLNNRFLNPPETMINEGFKGTPYRVNEDDI